MAVTRQRRRRGPVARPANAFAFDGVSPSEVHEPRSPAALAEVLRACDDAGRAVVLFGGGTLQELGFAPARYDAAISLTNLASVVEYECADLTIAVEGGLRVAALDATLAAEGQFIPLDAPLGAKGTVGGALAAGWLGPRRASYGRPRDFLIGATLVLADGTIAKAGGMVVKNSTGYDLSRLYVGSFGTLGALVRLNFKTLPLPAVRRVAISRLPERTLTRAIAHVAELELEPTAAVAIAGFGSEIDGRDGVDGRLFLLFEGSRALIDRATWELRSALGAAGVPETTILDQHAPRAFQRVLDAYVARLEERSVTYRSTGLPSDVVARAEMFARLAKTSSLDLETMLDLRTGDVIARLSTSAESDLASRIISFDAALHGLLAQTRVLAAPAPLRRYLAMWGAPPAALEKMRALKARFDPRGTLAPGRFVGGL